MINQRSKQLLSRLSVAVLIIASFAPSAVMADEPGYFITIGSSSLSDHTLTISGDGGYDLGGPRYRGTSLGYYVKVSWGDDTYSYSNTPGVDATDSFHSVRHGRKLEGEWSAVHTYATEGTFDVTVELEYNNNQPATPPVKDPTINDLSNDVTRAATETSIEIPELTPEGEPGYYIEVDSSGTEGSTVTVSGIGGYDLGGPRYEGTSLGYYVKISWGDGTYSYSDTGVDAFDTFITPDHGRTLTGTWTGTHTYESDGDYTITAELYYNKNQPAHPPVLNPVTSDLSNDVYKATDMTSISIED